MKSETAHCLRQSLPTNITLQLSCHIFPYHHHHTSPRRRHHSFIRKGAGIMSSSDNEPQDSNNASPLFHGVSGPDYVAAMKVALATDPALQAKVCLASISLPAHLVVHGPIAHTITEPQVSRRSLRRHRRQAARRTTIQPEVSPLPARCQCASSAAGQGVHPLQTRQTPEIPFPRPP